MPQNLWQKRGAGQVDYICRVNVANQFAELWMLEPTRKGIFRSVDPICECLSDKGYLDESIKDYFCPIRQVRLQAKALRFGHRRPTETNRENKGAA